MPSLLLLVVSLLCGPARAAAPPLKTELTGELAPARLQAHLQRFVDALYLKAFRHIGDERDFDHGHAMFDPVSGRPVAILYHTQELAADQPAGGEFGFVDPEGRNWIQWLDRDAIENARAYQRANYPSGASWRWFEAERLPALTRKRTIVDMMLDPERIGADTSRSLQWVFTRQDCGASAPAGAEAISVRLPTGEKVCLSLSAS